MIDRYRAAEAMLDANLAPLVLNESIHPHWFNDRDFWYRRQRPDGGEYVLVTGERAGPAFDHAAVAAAMGAATDAPVDPWSLAVEEITGDGVVILTAGNHRWRFAESVVTDLGAIEAPQPDVLLSPDKSHGLIARDHDLYLVGERGERRLTDDGQSDFAWGKYPDAGLLAVVRQRSGLRFPPFGWSWSPDGAFVVGGRLDERHIEPYPFLESVPQDGGFRPKAYHIRQPLTGEPNPIFSASGIEVATGRRIPFDLPAELSSEILSIEPIAWAAGNRRLFFAAALHGAREARLMEVDVTSGAVRTLIAERVEGFINLGSELYAQPNIRILGGGGEAIWYSQRTGFGHLYRYDLESGALVHALTSGDWVVRDILKVDEAGGRIFFTASGREGGDPYLRRVYRVDLDGSDLTLLTPEEADHMLNGAPTAMIALLLGAATPPAMLSPDSRLLIDTYSTVSSPSVSVLRSAEDGAIVRTLETADASALLATGWRPPEPFVAKAADGMTDLYGVLYRPHGQSDDPAPVIDAIYGGPQMTVTPRNFPAARRPVGAYGRSAFASLGFAVITVDGRGTPLRSKAFHDAGHRAFADTCVDDHAAVLRQLCDRDLTLDRNRIGIYGHSFGGYTSARAILRYPDIFKVAVSSAGIYNLHAIYRSITTITEAPDYGEGLGVKPDHRAVPRNFQALDNNLLAGNLRGKLMLVYGDMDENAFPAITLQFCDALNRANRSYDLLYLPNRMHALTAEPYLVRRMWDYFVEHLMGEEPPLNYSIGGGAAQADHRTDA
ncbi:alpha/beta fold hydrolase [Sphingosinicella sp. CPCC 101087]|uniref:S9 family peptidase n=1 Tax=Sphingosinicella sp. CPCC 101087 TaxID=2497754 RepID=UPI00101C8EF5|nr:alpha/beta fold hydrolase [Sphingosinicella sp. CPCC 101087]